VLSKNTSTPRGQASATAFVEIARAVIVDRLVEADLAAPGELVVAPGDADDAAAGDLRELADELAHRAGGCGDHHRVAGARAAHFEQAEICRHARHAEPGEGALDRREGGIDPVDAALRRAEERPFLPADSHGFHDVAGLEGGMVRDRHLADAAPLHQPADLDALGVAPGRADAPAHVGIDGEPFHANEDLPGAGLGDRLLAHAPGIHGGHALGILLQQPAAVHAVTHGASLTDSGCLFSDAQENTSTLVPQVLCS
jgi:hypothetical protein